MRKVTIWLALSSVVWILMIAGLFKFIDSANKKQEKYASIIYSEEGREAVYNCRLEELEKCQKENSINLGGSMTIAPKDGGLACPRSLSSGIDYVDICRDRVLKEMGAE